jgi:hypothetical protein
MAKFYLVIPASNSKEQTGGMPSNISDPKTWIWIWDERGLEITSKGKYV